MKAAITLNGKPIALKDWPSAKLVTDDKTKELYWRKVERLDKERKIKESKASANFDHVWEGVYAEGADK